MAPADEIKEQGIRFVQAGWRAVKVTAESSPVPTGFAAGRNRDEDGAAGIRPRRGSTGRLQEVLPERPRLARTLR